MRGDETLDALGVLNLARAGNARAEKIVQHRAGMVADIIVNLSLILNPGLILLEGEVAAIPCSSARCKSSFKKASLPSPGSAPVSSAKHLCFGVGLRSRSRGSLLFCSPARRATRVFSPCVRTRIFRYRADFVSRDLLDRVPHVPPDFLSSLVALANFMRLSLQKAAHANLAIATCRKSGSHQRTWDENDGVKPLPTL